MTTPSTPSNWEISKDDLPPDSYITQVPELANLENNAAFRLLTYRYKRVSVWYIHSSWIFRWACWYVPLMISIIYPMALPHALTFIILIFEFFLLPAGLRKPIQIELWGLSKKEIFELFATPLTPREFVLAAWGTTLNRQFHLIFHFVMCIHFLSGMILMLLSSATLIPWLYCGIAFFVNFKVTWKLGRIHSSPFYRLPGVLQILRSERGNTNQMAQYKMLGRAIVRIIPIACANLILLLLAMFLAAALPWLVLKQSSLGQLWGLSLGLLLAVSLLGYRIGLLEERRLKRNSKRLLDEAVGHVEAIVQSLNL